MERHIRAIGRGGEPDAQRLMARLQTGCWPGGAADRYEPAALEWVRRWRPVQAGAPRLVCLCAHGPCPICN